MRPFEFPTTVSVSVPLPPSPSRSDITIVPLSTYIVLSLRLSVILSVSPVRFLSIPLTPATHPSPPLSLSRSLVLSSLLYLSFCLSSSLFAFLFPCFSLAYCSAMLCSALLHSARRLACASIEPAEHRPILHLNLVNLPELANELRAWCLILAHEHGRRYTASNASGEGTRVQSSAKFADGRIARPIPPRISVVVDGDVLGATT